MEAHKKLIRAVTEEVMKDVLSKKAETVQEKTQVLLQAARAVYFDQGFMIPKIIKVSQILIISYKETILVTFSF